MEANRPLMGPESNGDRTENGPESLLSILDYRTSTPELAGSRSAICCSPCSDGAASFYDPLKDKEALYWKNQFYETIKQNQLFHVRENYFLGKIELLESQLAIQQRNADLNDLMVSEMLKLYHKLEEWQAYSGKLEDILRDVQLANSQTDEEKFLVQLFKFFKRCDFDGDESQFEELIREGRVHFYISNEGIKTESSSSLMIGSSDQNDDNNDDGNDNDAGSHNEIITPDCEKCLSSSDITPNKDENDNNIKALLSKRRRNKKKLSNGFWRYLRCTLAPKN